VSNDGLGVGCGVGVMAESGFIESESTAVSLGSLAIYLLFSLFEITLIVSTASLGGACVLLTSKLGTGSEVGGFVMPEPALS